METATIQTANCPLTFRTTSEDLLTANVFGILKNPDLTIWLGKFLGEAIKGKDFSRHAIEDLSFEFWKRYRPPVNRKHSRSSVWRHVAYRWLFGIEGHCGDQ